MKKTVFICIYNILCKSSCYVDKLRLKCILGEAVV